MSISEMDVEDMRDIFSNFDKTGRGNIESKDIGEVMRALGKNPTNEEVRKILDEIDPKGEKDVSFEEFVPLMRRKGQESDFTAFIECFKVFDRENNGMVNVAEIRHILCSMGEALSSKDADILLEGMEDNNGQINYEEFVRSIIDE